jgi:hypothetical protein
MTAAPDIARLQSQFAQFAAHSLQDEPLYRAIAERVATHGDWAALLAAAPPTQRWARLWFAALQDRVLARVEAGERPPLAAYFPAAGAPRAPDDALARHLGDFIDTEREALRESIATRGTQTNEIGRCAVLWPLLQDVVADTGRTRIALLDVGCSAGLNLGVDRWRYRWVDDATGQALAATPADRDPAAPEITCRLLAGARPRAGAMPEIVTRRGIDLQPIAVDDAREVRWLRACLWPQDVERRRRFDAAVAIARTQRWPLRQVADAAAGVAEWLAELPPDVTPVVFNSWVLAYFDDALLRRHVDAMLEMVARRGAVWISAEDPTQSRTWWPGLPERAEDKRGNATSWTVARADGQGGVAWKLAATSHAHGHWMLYEG